MSQNSEVTFCCFLIARYIDGINNNKIAFCLLYMWGPKDRGRDRWAIIIIVKAS